MALQQICMELKIAFYVAPTTNYQLLKLLYNTLDLHLYIMAHLSIKTNDPLHIHTITSSFTVHFVGAKTET